MKYSNQIKGAINRNAGKTLEKLITNACEIYKESGKAVIEKTPEPMKILKAMGQGRFVTVFEKKAQPDYKGTLRGGQAIVFEAKFTSKDRIQRSAVTPKQSKELDQHEKAGALCFVLVSFSFKKNYLVPWSVFRDCADLFERRYLKPEDLPEYYVPLLGYGIDFLREIRV